MSLRGNYLKGPYNHPPPKGNPSMGFTGFNNINSHLLGITNMSKPFLHIISINSFNRYIYKVYIIPYFR